MKKYFLLFIGIILFASGSFFIIKNRSNPVTHGSTPSASTKLQVVASFYPLQYFAQQVGGENIAVLTLTPAGGEPHDYEPTPQDIIKITKADVLVLNGAHLEPWADKLLPQLQNKNIQVIKMSDHVELLRTQVANGGDQEESEGQFDPHFWLDPVQARIEVNTLRDAFITKDPLHADVYRKNAAQVIDKLSAVEQNFQTGLASCHQKEIITSHNAYQYLAHRFHFTVQAIGGFSPDQDPSPKHLVELSKMVQEKNLKYIFTETLASPKFSETLAKETHIQTLVLNPLEGLTDQDMKQGKNYFTVMEENLQNLRLAMECK